MSIDLKPTIIFFLEYKNPQSKMQIQKLNQLLNRSEFFSHKIFDLIQKSKNKVKILIYTTLKNSSFRLNNPRFC